MAAMNGGRMGLGMSSEAEELLQLLQQVLSQEIVSVKALVLQQLAQYREEFDARMSKLEDRLEVADGFGRENASKVSSSLSQAATRFFRKSEGGLSESELLSSRTVHSPRDHEGRPLLEGPVAGGLSLFISGASTQGLPTRLGDLRPVPEMPEEATPPLRARSEREGIREEVTRPYVNAANTDDLGPGSQPPDAKAAELHRTLHQKVAMAAVAVREAADAAKIAQCKSSQPAMSAPKENKMVCASTQTTTNTVGHAIPVVRLPGRPHAYSIAPVVSRSASVPPSKVMVAPPAPMWNHQVQSPRVRVGIHQGVHTPRTPSSTALMSWMLW